MKVAFLCAMILGALTVAAGVFVLFQPYIPLFLRVVLSVLAIAAGVGIGSLLLELIKEDDNA